MDEKFKMNSYGFGEFALLYFPNTSKKRTSAQFRGWIKLSKAVILLLLKLGYMAGNLLLTPAHVKLIVGEFGES